MQTNLSTVKKRTFAHFPWGVFLFLLTWIGFGLVNLYSATYKAGDLGLPLLFKSQLVWISLGFVVLFLVTLFDYHFLFRWAYPLYGLSLVLLSLVFIKSFGKSVAGQQNWISIAGFSFQPSEIAKLAFILVLARFYSSHETQISELQTKDLVIPFLLFLAPTTLVILQKDLGSSLFFGCLFLSLSFFLRIKTSIVVFTALMALLGVAGAYKYALKDYQKARIRTFLNPELDPKGKGYHVVQSKTAVGSGGLLGRGYLQGNINKLKFLPERHTDFIFPVFAEEWGFLGCAVLLTMMALFLLLGLEAAAQTKDAFGAFLALGVIALFFWHVVINLGGVLGLLPLTGVPLPLLSYGGSSVLTMMLGVGIILNVRMRRFMF